MHVSNQDVRSEQGRPVQYTLYVRKCCVSVGLATMVVDQGYERTPVRPDG